MGACGDMLAVTPAVGDDEVIQADAHDTLGYEPVPEVVGKAFIVSTKSVKISTWYGNCP